MKQTLNNKIYRVEYKKNKTLSCNLVIFQTFLCYYMEFVLNFRILITLILTHFKLMFNFYTPENINKIWVSDVFGFRNGMLVNSDYQQY